MWATNLPGILYLTSEEGHTELSHTGLSLRAVQRHLTLSLTVHETENLGIGEAYSLLPRRQNPTLLRITCF